MADGLVDIPHSVLASLLESVNNRESEGVLICRNKIEAWDTDQIARAFAIFQFNLFAGTNGDGELTFSHEESGTSLSYTGIGVSIAYGGQITDALPDLLRALSSLGWSDIDVYSMADEFYDDLATGMPASVDINLSRRDIPADLSEDLTQFSAAVAASAHDTTSDTTSNVEEFNRVFAAREGLSPPSPTIQQTPLPVQPAATPGMGVGVRNNYIPEDSDLALPVPAVAGEEDLPVPMVVAPGEARPAFSLLSPSPLTDTATVAAPSADTTAVSAIPVVPVQEVAPVSIPVAPVGIKQEETAAAAKNVISGEAMVPPRCAVSSAVISESSSDGMAGDDWGRTSIPLLVEPILIGDAVVVLDSYRHPLDPAVLKNLRNEGGQQREVVLVEPGASVVTTEHVFWSPCAEVAYLLNMDGTDELGALRSLVASLWPNDARDHLLILALLVLLCVEANDDHPATLSNLLKLAQLEPSAVIAKLKDIRPPNPLIETLISQAMAMNCGSSLERIVEVLRAVPLTNWDTAYEGDNSPPLSFFRVAQGGDKRIFVVTIDAMDCGCVEEFLALGLVRWVTRIAKSRRIFRRKATEVSAAEQQAAKMLEQLPPELIAAMKAVLSQKR